MSSESSTAPRRQSLRGFVAALSGTTLEWYDFAIYSASSALVFGHVFFPSGDPAAGTLLAFGTYAVGYVARPLGSIFFGRLGDIVGRKKVLVWTLLLIGVATVVIGAIPSYATIGIVAPIALIALRLAQGVGVGGEWAGAVLISSEHGDPEKRGLYGSAAQIGPPLGNLMANGMLALLAASLTTDQFLSWGWRIAFLVSALLVGAGLIIRVKLEETPVFEELQETGRVSRSPITEVLRDQRKALVAATLSRIAPDVMYAMSTVFVLTYATQRFGYSKGQALLAVVIGSAIQVFMVPAAGYLSDRLNRRAITAVGALCSLIWPMIFFPLMESAGYLGVVLAVIGGLFCNSLMYGPQAALVSEQFEPRLRYAGSSLAYGLGGLLGGAIAPLTFAFLLSRFGTWYPLAGYIAVATVVTMTGVALAKDPGPDQHHPDRSSVATAA